MQTAIGVIVLGAIGLIVFAAVSPTLFGSFGNTYQQTQAACVLNGERFTAVNSEKDWSGTDYPLTAEGTNCDTTLTSATTVYTPSGAQAAAAETSGNITSGNWEAALAIMSKQSGINRLVITILPLLTVIGAVGLLYSWHKNRQTA